MKRKYTTTRKMKDGKQIKIFIDEDGKIYITAEENDGFTIDTNLIIDCFDREVHDLNKESYLQKIAEF